MLYNSGFKLIATLGPASANVLAQLNSAGVTEFRINASHTSEVELQELISSAKAQVADCKLVVDLQGGKMRLGAFEPRELRSGEMVRFARASETPSDLEIPHNEFFSAVNAGDVMRCDDGRIEFRIAKLGPGFVDATCTADCVLCPRKGVSIANHALVASGLSNADSKRIEVALSLGVRSFAFSFMIDGREASWVRSKAPGARVIGKIERREAIGAIPSIAQAVDEIWICRGDLGVELAQPGLARWLHSFRPETVPVPVCIAGQVLEHLTAHRHPTRSEVCHLFDLISRGFLGVVLSDETAIGIDPISAASTLSSLLRDFRLGTQS